MSIAAGTLRNRIRIETPTNSRSSDYGDIVQTWSLLGNGEVWASIRPISGRERWEANAVNPDVTHRIMIRYHPTVSPKDRIIFGTRTFYIQSALNLDERSEMIELLAIEEV